ncbi:hypothetical protein QYM36_012937 [Artemia franciscana]|uniref:Uncharacterized protein n=1 Tax=Artemia franciscana TaxID=6661 RepID=A0AA88HK66_ARTSF|nr:hypothetical protein QYM36_012937 [Artemia franciscana]
MSMEGKQEPVDEKAQTPVAANSSAQEEEEWNKKIQWINEGGGVCCIPLRLISKIDLGGAKGFAVLSYRAWRATVNWFADLATCARSLTRLVNDISELGPNVVHGF